MIDLISKNHLAKLNLNEAILIEKFSIQLHKDFEMCDAKNYIVNINSFEYNDLKTSIAKALESITIKENYKYKALLYRIDISEIQLQRALQNQLDSNPFLITADLIIKRILQKVILKLTYSKL